MKQNFKIGVPLMGSVIMLIVSLVLAALLAVLFGSGTLPLQGMPVAAWIITFFGCLLGGMWGSGKVNTMPLPTALIAVVVYLLLVFVLRGLLFGAVGDRPYILVLAALAGAVIGAVLSAGKGRKKRH